MNQNDNRPRILFLCTANAARSQMAEGLARARYGERLEALSAGSRPAGFVHPLAIAALADSGIDISNATSKGADRFLDVPIDVVVTVCDSAARECPVWPRAGRLLHWPIEDPTWPFGDPRAQLLRFIETRDELLRRIDELVTELGW